VTRRRRRRRRYTPIWTISFLYTVMKPFVGTYIFEINTINFIR